MAKNYKGHLINEIGDRNWGSVLIDLEKYLIDTIDPTITFKVLGLGIHTDLDVTKIIVNSASGAKFSATSINGDDLPLCNLAQNDEVDGYFDSINVIEGEVRALYIDGVNNASITKTSI